MNEGMHACTFVLLKSYILLCAFTRVIIRHISASTRFRKFLTAKNNVTLTLYLRIVYQTSRSIRSLLHCPIFLKNSKIFKLVNHGFPSLSSNPRFSTKRIVYYQINILSRSIRSILIHITLLFII